MATELENCASFKGTQLGTPIELPTECVMTLLADVTVEKTASREIWGTGTLTYTLTLVNNEAEPITGATVEDLLDPDLIVFVDDSLTVTIGTTPVDDPQHTYDTSGLLTVTIGDIPAGAQAVVSFQVSKAP